MARRPLTTLVLILAVCAPRAFAEEPKKDKAAPPPVMASDAEAKEALATFKVEFKAKGLKGDEKLMQQDYAMRELAKVQHPLVVAELAKLLRNRNANLYTMACMYLGKQAALPAHAGRAILNGLKKHSKDETFLMSALEALADLRYLGAQETLRSLLLHNEYAVVKYALMTIGELEDARMVEDIYKLMKKIKLEKGAKWDGVEVNYDTGAPGTHDQEMAEAIGQAQMAKNKGKGKKAGRSMRDLGPVVLQTMKRLTGQEFTGAIQTRKWLDDPKNAQVMKDSQAKVQKVADEQAASLKSASKKKKR